MRLKEHQMLFDPNDDSLGFKIIHLFWAVNYLTVTA